jgi:HTH-type transcriptional regulator/antitoxin HipB
MMQRTATELGALVRYSRVHRGLSQQELATRAGLTREWLGRLEAGAPRLEMSKVLLAMNALDIRIETPDTFPTREDVRRAERREYLEALREADGGDYSHLVEVATRYSAQ